MVAPQCGDTILDLGCGNGYFTGILSKNPNCRIIGIDVSFASLLNAKRWYAGAYLNGSCMELPFRDVIFDKALLTDVIEHLENPDAAMAEIRRVLKKGGHLIITTPALEGMLTGSPLNLLYHNDPDSHEYHWRAGYSHAELSDMLARHGMKLIEVSYCTTLLGEVMIELIKVIYLLRGGRLHSQADLDGFAGGKLFKTYRMVFPFLHQLAKLEDRTLGRFVKGHVLIVKGRVL
jgi:ubiquinone/menaquinone biosynthesis C-methylase UbiE